MMMRKLAVAAVAGGTVLALRPAIKRRMVQKAHEHCRQMMRP